MRRAVGAVSPYVSRFEEWNRRAAHLTALASRLQDPLERAEKDRDLAELRDEVSAAYQAFESVVTGHRHGRIDDVRAAFRRLIVKLADGRTPTLDPPTAAGSPDHR